MQALDASITAHLERLQEYLVEDPHNSELLAATCDAAIEAGAYECAQNCVASAQALKLPWRPWVPRVARLALGLAIAHFERGDMESARSELAPWMTGEHSEDEVGDAQAPMQVLWLRATHRCGLVAGAAAWAERQMKRGRLQPAAAGVASLAAVDAGDFTLAAELAQAALAAGTMGSEALVALASVALARRDADVATRLLQQALAACPEDGRTQSLLGMVHLQGRELAQAQACFTQALATLPAHVGTWHGLGWACLLQGDQTKASEAFGQALQLDRNFAESHGAVGLMLLLAGRRAEANHHLDAADRLDRGNVTGRYARALATGQLGDAQALQALAARLLDRPGLFGGSLQDELAPRSH